MDFNYAKSFLQLLLCFLKTESVTLCWSLEQLWGAKFRKPSGRSINRKTVGANPPQGRWGVLSLVVSLDWKTENSTELEGYIPTEEPRNCSLTSPSTKEERQICFGSFYGQVCPPLLRWAESMLMTTQAMSSGPSGHPPAGVVVGTAGMVELVTLEEKLHPKWYY